MHLLEFVFILLDWDSLDVQLSLQSCCLTLKILVAPQLQEVRTRFRFALNIYFHNWTNQNTKNVFVFTRILNLVSVFTHCRRLYGSEWFILVSVEPPLLFYLHSHPGHTKSATVPPQPAGETWLPLLERRFPPAWAVCSCVVPLCCGPAPAAGWETDTSPPALQCEHADRSSPSVPSATVLSAWKRQQRGNSLKEQQE